MANPWTLRKTWITIACGTAASLLTAGILLAVTQGTTAADKRSVPAVTAEYDGPALAVDVSSGGSLYDTAFQQEVLTSLQALEAEGTYTLCNPLIKSNPFGTNTLSLYVHFTTETAGTVRYTVQTVDGSAAVFTRTAAGEAATEHTFQLIGLTPEKQNVITLSLLDEAGDTIEEASFSVTAPALLSGVAARAPKTAGDAQAALSDGLYVLLGTDAQSSQCSYALLYDNEGWVRGEIPLESYRPDRLTFTDDRLIYPISSTTFAFVNALGMVEQTVSMQGYTMHHDYVLDKNGDILALVTKTGADTQQDFVVRVDPDTGVTTPVIDLGTLLPAAKAAASSQAEQLDWAHINALSLCGDDAVVLSCRELSTIVKISGIYGGEPTVDYLIADESIWKGLAGADRLLTKVGDFPSQAGQHSVTVIEDPDLPAGQYYLCFYNNNYGQMTTRTAYDWSQIPGVGSFDTGKQSMIYLYLVDESARTYTLAFRKDVPYSSIVSSAQQVGDRYIANSGMAKQWLECTAEGETIATFSYEVEQFGYRVFKYTFAGFWFA